MRRGGEGCKDKLEKRGSKKPHYTPMIHLVSMQDTCQWQQVSTPFRVEIISIHHNWIAVIYTPAPI